MNKYFAWNSTAVPVLVQKETTGQYGLHLLVAEIRVSFSICRKFFGIVRDKFEPGAVRIENLTTAGSIFVAICVFLYRIT